MSRNKLLIIDPQNDFMPLEGATLGVPGATDDMDRLVRLIDSDVDHFGEIAVTLDSHAHYGIERPSFWVDNSTGKAPVPFTSIKLEDLLSGRFAPKNLDEYSRVKWVLSELENKNSGSLMVWPAHCVVGTWGHCIYAPLAQALARWQEKYSRPVKYVFKGQNPGTEHFSAIKADVVLADDPHTDWNKDLLSWVGTNRTTLLWVAGEASSHCVRHTVSDILEWNAKACMGEKGPTLVLLTDCMSPVPGHEKAHAEFFEEAVKAGCLTYNSVQGYF